MVACLTLINLFTEYSFIGYVTLLLQMFQFKSLTAKLYNIALFYEIKTI